MRPMTQCYRLTRTPARMRTASSSLRVNTKTRLTDTYTQTEQQLLAVILKSPINKAA